MIIKTLFTGFIKDQKALLKKGQADLILKQFADFLRADLAEALDKLPGDFFRQNYEQRLAKLLPNSAQNTAVRRVLLNEDYHAIVEAVQEFLQKLDDAAPLVVQLPTEIGPEVKSKIRKSLAKSHPRSFPAFYIEPGILGGMRIFQDGKMLDRSFRMKLKALSAIS